MGLIVHRLFLIDYLGENKKMDFYHAVVFVLLFFTFIIGLITVLVMSFMYKWDLTENELQLLKKGSNRQCVIAIIIQLLMPIIFLPIYNIFVERRLLVTFITAFFCIVFSFYTFTRIIQCILLSREIKKRKKRVP